MIYIYIYIFRQLRAAFVYDVTGIAENELLVTT